MSPAPNSAAESPAPPLPAEDNAAPIRFGFQNTYAQLAERFYARINPTPVAAPRLIKLNVELARDLNLDPAALASPGGLEVLAGNRLAADSTPLALAYAGHQFGYFVPQLGDGRAHLLGEVLARDGRRYDIQLKGSGPTPFSRRGDGRAALAPVLREYLVSEAMAALGVPTARALAAVTTGQPVLRETPQPGAVFTRVAASHLRVGTFQYFAAKADPAALRQLADYAVARHYPEAAHAQRPYRALLDAVIARQARLIAQWMNLGFIHGVMNTDNTAISGETIDYGPCAFMEAYDPAQVYSSIDTQGRYSYSNQPHAAHWNLARLAEALLPLLLLETGSQESHDMGSQQVGNNQEAALASAYEALAAFGPQYEAARLAGLRRKLGLFTEHDGDAALAEDLLQRMAASRADFTLTFRRLCASAANPHADVPVRALFGIADPTAPDASDDSGTASGLVSDYDTWAAAWRRRLQQEPAPPQARAALMRSANPLFIPRNHLVEAALQAAVTRQDFQPFEDLLAVVTHPCEDPEDRPDLEPYTTPARPDQHITQTFCGT
jgi:uncharacterized protein YdiU (UPF0061 family)